MAESFYTLRGIDFDVSIPKWQAQFMIWKHWREPYYQSGDMHDPWECFIEGAQEILTHDEWAVSRWSLEHTHDWTTESFIVTWGCASSSKSNDTGLFALIDWIVDPLETAVMMASTTRDALLKRTFESTTRYFRLLKKKGLTIPGKLSATAKAIVLDGAEADDSDKSPIYKAGIHGIAVREGSTSAAVGNIRGVHLPYVRLVADELNEMPEAIVDPELLINLQTGSMDFKFSGLTNIRSFNDLAGLNSVPIAKGGWNSINIDTEMWRTVRGITRRHDGFKSPALTPEGAVQFPHLLNQRQLDEFIRHAHGNKDDPSIYKMVRAWPPTIGSDDVVVTVQEARDWGFEDVSKLEWLAPPTAVAALDPGYGGDACVLQLAWAGTLSNGLGRIAFEEQPRVVPIDGSPGAKTVTEQILDFCLPVLQGARVSPEHFAVDDSGPQSIADAFAMKWGNELLRCSFGATPSETPVSAFNPKLGIEAYGMEIAESVYMFREYGMSHQICRLNAKALWQLTNRLVIAKAKKKNLESKKEYKERTKKGSPDELDAAAMCLRVIKLRLGFMPGSNEWSPGGPVQAWVPGVEDKWSDDALREMNNFKPTYKPVI